MKGIDLKLNMKVGYLHIKDKTLHFDRNPNFKIKGQVALIRNTNNTVRQQTATPVKKSFFYGIESEQTGKQFLCSVNMLKWLGYWICDKI